MAVHDITRLIVPLTSEIIRTLTVFVRRRSAVSVSDTRGLENFIFSSQLLIWNAQEYPAAEWYHALRKKDSAIPGPYEPARG